MNKPTERALDAPPDRRLGAVETLPDRRLLGT